MSASSSMDHLLCPLDLLDGEEVGVSPFYITGAILDGAFDDFFVSRRSSAVGSNEVPWNRRPCRREDVLGEIESEAVVEEQIIAVGDDPVGCETDLPFCWECLQIDEDRRVPAEEFEWEEIAGHSDEGEIHGSTGFAEDEISSHRDGEDAARSADWELLLPVEDLGRNDIESIFLEDHEAFVDASDYDVLLGQFGEHNSARPAAKSAVDSLPSFLWTEEDVTKNRTQYCAVCKDEIWLTEMVKMLPCMHHYHEDCILPWLDRRNTCPLCRYELPSSEEEVERWKAAAGVGDTSHDFEVLPTS
ncbi:E3 ubiquitin-protein ligase RING1-like [Apostasia shenzhenica]|uniref:E3 ubiquitin-protein ligase RING1-like n=1 Tax=Apostasia shenzhenica TaxID=1088818 RepID=A0A2I0B3Z3_9ASPA|nr:E3 ubiquitin-protein ligase RING1-like [Apostasia shenzhenica]